jgi:hypothetical protein
VSDEVGRGRGREKDDGNITRKKEENAQKGEMGREGKGKRHSETRRSEVPR